MRAHSANNIGFLRLCFASLVIVGHAPEMVYGDRTREPLTRLFHTLSLGEVSVDAFFLLSGYLITKSMVRTERCLPFLERRALRIYPAFIVASLISVFLLGPLVGAEVWTSLPTTIARMLLLREPGVYPGQFPGLHTYPLLNGSLWTISYEFRCYILVALLGIVGCLRHRGLFLSITAAMLLISVLATFPEFSNLVSHLDENSAVRLLIIRLSDAVRLVPIFMVGACWFLYESEMKKYVSARIALFFAILCCFSLYEDPHFAELGLTIFGGVTLYWVAFKAEIGPLQKINDKWDISYGTYLYGWPIAIYIVWKFQDVSPWAVAAVSLPLALLAGAASWWGLERWTKDLVRSRSTRNSDARQPNKLLYTSKRSETA